MGDSLPRIDPQVSTNNAGALTPGVNQWVIVANDGSANNLPIAMAVHYIPLYLHLR